MRRTICMLIAVLFIPYCVGCGSDSSGPAETASPQQTGSQSTAQQQSPEEVLVEDDSPSGVVYYFLQAVQQGQDEEVVKFMTKLAREMNGSKMAPVRSDTATFEVYESKAISDDIAHVPSSWTDIDRQNNPHTDEITWILKKEADGWRIGGMLTTIFPDKEPFAFNFENPQQIQEVLQAIQLESSKRSSGTVVKEAKANSDPFAGERK